MLCNATHLTSFCVLVGSRSVHVSITVHCGVSVYSFINKVPCQHFHIEPFDGEKSMFKYRLNAEIQTVVAPLCMPT